MLSGLAMIVVGVWVTTQAIGGNLAGRIRSWAGAATGATDSSSNGGGSTPSEPSGAAGSGGGGSRAK